jgi:myosin heavy subunit
LEQVRVTDHQQGERSFHIFYQTLAGANSEETLSRELHLDELVGLSPLDFDTLSSSAHVRMGHSDDAQDFISCVSSLRVVGFNTEQISAVFGVIAAVLFLGNVRFETPAGNSEGSQIAKSTSTRSPFAVASESLGVDAKEFEQGLCMRSVQAPEGLIYTPNKTRQAEDVCEATARHLYHCLFRKIVHRINESIGYEENATFCGVLDIFGFEFFQVNTFEQLSINFTNELLQQFFNTFIFKNEETLYAQEGIPWTPLDFPDNGNIVALISQNTTGIFPMLDEECFVINGSSSAWYTKLLKEHENHERFRFLKHEGGKFIVEHFAGDVTYTAEGFLEKNRDRLSQDVLRCLKNSGTGFVKDLFSELELDLPSKERGTAAKKRQTVSSEFRQQLQELMSQIKTTHPHFVRCIKPNPQNKPFAMAGGGRQRQEAKPLFHRKSVAEQLNYQGVLEAIRVARAGYPVRFSHADFFCEFRVVADKDQRIIWEASVKASGGSADTRIVDELLKHLEAKEILPVSEGACKWALGKTQVFLKQAPFGALKAAQTKKRKEAATRIQAIQRRHFAQLFAAKKLKSLIALQAYARGKAGRAATLQLRQNRAAEIIVCHCQMLLARAHMHRVQHAAKKGQSLFRMRRDRAEFLRTKAKIVKLQAWSKAKVGRMRFLRLPVTVLHVQRVWRGHCGRREAFWMKFHRLRLFSTIRMLVRIRRRNYRRRQWRTQMMQLYKGAPRPAPPQVGTLLKEFESLEEERKVRLRMVAAAWERHRSMKHELEEAQASIFSGWGF